MINNIYETSFILSLIISSRIQDNDNDDDAAFRTAPLSLLLDAKKSIISICQLNHSHIHSTPRDKTSGKTKRTVRELSLTILFYPESCIIVTKIRLFIFGQRNSYSKRQIFLYIAPQNVAILKVEEALRRKASQIIFVVYYSFSRKSLSRKSTSVFHLDP